MKKIDAYLQKELKIKKKLKMDKVAFEREKLIIEQVKKKVI